MKLNPDCIRDILIEVEKNSTFTLGLVIDADKQNPLFDKYSWDELAYHIDQCDLSGLLTSIQIFDSNKYAIIDNISPKGHEFLANIRDNTIWHKTKSIASQIGSTSLNSLVQVAGNVISQLILSHFKQ